MKLNVPFYKQTTEMNCGPLALKMALDYLGKNLSIEELEKQTELKRGKALPTIKLALVAKQLGFRTKFFTKNFENNPENLKMDFYKKYWDMNGEESQRIFQEAEKAGIELHEKTLSLENIINNIREDRIIIILLDWNVIAKKQGYQGHFVPVVGYDEENIYIHNQGFDSPQAFMPIKRQTFDKARKAKGTDEDLLIIYRK